MKGQGPRQPRSPVNQSNSCDHQHVSIPTTRSTMTISHPNNDRDSGQFISLFAKNQHAVHAYIRALVSNRSDVDDIMQEVSLTLWNKWQSFEPGSDFLRWSCAVAFIEILRYRRKTAKDRLWFNESLLELLAADFREHADQYANRLDALSKCIEKLNKEDRRLLDLRHRGGG